MENIVKFGKIDFIKNSENFIPGAENFDEKFFLGAGFFERKIPCSGGQPGEGDRYKSI